MMNTIEEWPRPVLGPTIWNRLGKPAIVVPLYAAMPVLAPRVGEGAAVATLDVLGDGLLGGVEAGRHDDRVDLALGAVAR